MEITIDEFKKVELRIAQIIEVEEIPGSNKLYRLLVDAGDKKKQIVAGIKPNHSKEELEGMFVVIVDNMKPAKLMGVESHGMLLAADGEDGPIILTPEKAAKPGTNVK